MSKLAINSIVDTFSALGKRLAAPDEALMEVIETSGSTMPGLRPKACCKP
jgi:hypothetical protein